MLFEAASNQRPSTPGAPPGVPPAAKPAAPPPVTDVIEFGEEAYCEAYPDIHAAIRNGMLGSAAAHFRQHGRQERRLVSDTYLQALVGRHGELPGAGAAFSVDAAIISKTGMVFVVGWADDRVNLLRSLSVMQGTEGSNTRAIARCRRGDVDALLQAPKGYAFGFWLIMKLEFLVITGRGVTIRARLADGSFEQRDVQASITTDADLRDTVLGHFASLEYYGNRDIEAFTNLETGAGQALANFNQTISRGITAMCHAEYYGPRRKAYRASIIVCLFGKLEYFFLQNAAFAKGIGVEEYEFIYVSNSPELAESLQKEARIAERIYGLSVTLVTLPGNAGFSAANNAAVRYATSERIVFMNPDVFPRDRHWLQTHAAIVRSMPREHTALFGAPLYYDDGSLMHGGMYFDIDQGLSVKPGGISTHCMVRVEHFGKGAPAWSDRYTQPRPVPAVTGALISADRDWFQNLGGFTEDYLFGHYEDADLCLKSLRQGVPVWLHDVRFWHLEGKGSIRRPPHEGGSLVNRWLFTRRWGSIIQANLAGRKPSHPLLSPIHGRQAAMPPRPAPVAAPAAARGKRPARALMGSQDG